MYPAAIERWRSLATDAASRAGASAGVSLPVDLVLAVVWKESSGNPAAVGDGGASLGLMQVQKATARDLGIQDPRLLFDPRVALLAGSTYLARQLARYGGRVAHAVAAYNAGSARFTQDERFVNQGYVDRVFEYWRRSSSTATGIVAGAGGGLAVALGLGVLLAVVARRRRRAA